VCTIFLFFDMKHIPAGTYPALREVSMESKEDQHSGADINRKEAPPPADKPNSVPISITNPPGR
jgi:hypothetical protein